jgi:hypothetical protein
MQGVKGSIPLSSTAGQGLFLPSTDRRSPAPGSRLAATAVAQADPSPTGAFTGGAGWRRLVGRRARGLRPPSDLWLSSQHQMINGGRRAGGLPQRPGATGGGELAGRGRAACGCLVGAGGRSPRRSWASEGPGAVVPMARIVGMPGPTAGSAVPVSRARTLAQVYDTSVRSTPPKHRRCTSASPSP